MKKNAFVLWGGVGALLIVGGAFAIFHDETPGKFDAFATCLKEKGAIFYGAWWCPHCQNQKKMFGSSTKHLQYVECSSVGRRDQLPVCQEAKIESYPTWEFADKSRLTGEIPLTEFAEKTGCTLPVGE